MKRIPLILSLSFNIFFVVAIFGIRLHYHKMIFRTLYNVTTAEVRFHETILTELKSEDTYKVEAVKAALEKNIQDRKEAAEVWKATAERIRLR